MENEEKSWHILFCDEDDKYCSISEFIESLPQEGQIKVFKFLELLSKNGPQLRRPYSDLLYDGIHELRLRIGKIYARILYFFIYGNFIILQSGFNKKTDRTPDMLVEHAIEYRDMIIDKYSEQELKENLMLQFKKFLKQKLEDKEFCQAYADNCNICQTIWQIVDTVTNSGLSWADISAETGISESDLRDFASGDKCQPHIIETLCQKLDIDLPAECPRFKF